MIAARLSSGADAEAAAVGEGNYQNDSEGQLLAKQKRSHFLEVSPGG
jgi:hypothetical protein